MANTRFSLVNLVEFGTIKNGSGGGAPATNESGVFAMTRAQNADRRSLWKTSAGTSPILFDVDLGAISTVEVGAVLGLTVLPSGDSGALTVQYATSYYPGAWTDFGTAANWSSGDRDVGVVAAAVAARYWRFSIAPSSALNLKAGRIWLGSLTPYDLGGIHSPGGTSSPRQNRLEQVMQDGSYNLNTLGFPGRDITLPFEMVPSATRDQLHDIAATAGSVLLVDAEDNVFECIVRGGAAPTTRSNALYGVGLELARLP